MIEYPEHIPSTAPVTVDAEETTRRITTLRPPSSPRAVAQGEALRGPPVHPFTTWDRITATWLLLQWWAVGLYTRARRAWRGRKALKWKDVPQRPDPTRAAPAGLIMRRCHLFTTPWKNEYVLHLILNPDNMALGLHRHPWDFWSVVLWGGYTEEYLPDWIDPTDPDARRWSSRIRYRGLLSFASHPAAYTHAIVGLRMRRPALTLCRQGKRRPEGWDFPQAGVKGG